MRARRARLDDVEAICRVCADGVRDTYRGLWSDDEIERSIAHYYDPERVRREVEDPQGWDGWWVAEDDGRVVAAGGGGMVGDAAGEIFVLYADPRQRRRGAGTLVLEAITERQVEAGAREQWAAVTPGNAKGIPFYLARGFEQRGTRASPEDFHADDNLLFWRRVGRQ
jgi:GNAT superfamily N-acetyltransferase